MPLFLVLVLPLAAAKPTKEQKRIAQRDIHIRLAQLYMEQNDFVDAYEHMTIALENDPRCAPCYAMRGEIAMEREYLPLAAGNYRQACLYAPDSATYHMEYARALMFLDSTGSAAIHLEQALRLNPDLLEAERLTALNLYLQDDYRHAIDTHLAYMHHFMFAEHYAPEQEELFLTIPDSMANEYLLRRLDSCVRHSEGDIQNMYRTTFTKVLYQVLGTRLIDCYQQGRWAAAQRIVERLQQTEPADYSLYLLHGQCAFEQEQFKISERDWLFAGEKDSTHASMAYHLLGCQYYYQKRYTEAIEALDESIRHDRTKNPHAYLFRGRSYLALGDTLVANEDFETILEEDTSYYNSVRQFALLYLGEREEAVNWQENLLRTAPKSDIYFSAACFYALLGEDEQAGRMLDEAIAAGYHSMTSIRYSPELSHIRQP